MGSARRKLNVAYLNGCLLAAAAFGWLAQSWAVFLVVLDREKRGCFNRASGIVALAFGAAVAAAGREWGGTTKAVLGLVARFAAAAAFQGQQRFCQLD